LQQMEAELTRDSGQDVGEARRQVDLAKCLGDLQNSQLALARAVEGWHARAGCSLVGAMHEALLPLGGRPHRALLGRA
jgi:hypothetical protein